MLKTCRLAIWLKFIAAVYPDVYSEIPKEVLHVMNTIYMKPEYKHNIGDMTRRQYGPNDKDYIAYLYMPLMDYLELSYRNIHNDMVTYCFQPTIIIRKLRKLRREKEKLIQK